MQNRYIKKLTTFLPVELEHKFDPLDFSCDKDSMVLTEKILNGRDIILSKHDWKMHAMYHSLQTYKFAYIHSGSFLIYTDGKPTRLNAGSLCIVPPGVVQKFTIDYSKADTSDTVMVNILVRSSAVTDILYQVFAGKNEVSEYLYNTFYKESFSEFMVLRTPGEFTRDIAEALFTELMSSAEKDDPPYTAGCLLSALIFSYLKPSENYTVEISSAYTGSTEAINRIIRCIQLEFKDITLEELCRRFHYTPSYICRIIKRHTGMTYKEYLSNERLDNVCKTLILTDKPIRDAAAEAGWQTLEHFYRVFHKKYGMTPLEYRTVAKKKLL